jgi:hypothetical protein
MFRHVMSAMNGQIDAAEDRGLEVKEFRMREVDWAAIAEFLAGHPYLASEVPGAKRYRSVPVVYDDLPGGGILVAELSNGIQATA